MMLNNLRNSHSAAHTAPEQQNLLPPRSAATVDTGDVESPSETAATPPQQPREPTPWRERCADLFEPAASGCNALGGGAKRLWYSPAVRGGGTLGLRVGGTLAALRLYENLVAGREYTPHLVGELLEYFTNEVKPYEGISALIADLASGGRRSTWLQFPEKLADYTTWGLGKLCGIAADQRHWFLTRHVGDAIPEDCVNSHAAHLPPGCPNRSLDAWAVELRPVYTYVAYGCLLGLFAGAVLHALPDRVKHPLHSVVAKVGELAHGISVEAFTQPASDMLRGEVLLESAQQRETELLAQLQALREADAPGRPRSKDQVRSIKKKLHALLEANEEIRHAQTP